VKKRDMREHQHGYIDGKKQQVYKHGK